MVKTECSDSHTYFGMRMNNCNLPGRFYSFPQFFFQDNNGTIGNEELRGFLKDLLELVKKVRERFGDQKKMTIFIQFP